MRVAVYHRGYGCDTGCCGHVIEVDGDYEGFVFDHAIGTPGAGGAKNYNPTEEEKREWAKQLVAEELGKEHVADIDWSECLIFDYGC